MPNAPPRPCPRCRRLVLGRCATCARARDQARGTAHARGYTKEWAEYSRTWLLRYPWCGMRSDGQIHNDHSRCAQRGLKTKATCTDHIRAMRFGGAQFDPANHESMCGDCNRRKNIKLEGGFGR